MLLLILGIILFFGVHSLSIVNEPWRDRMANKLGEVPFKGIYSLFSLLGLVLLIYGYGQARLDPVVLYTPPMWLRHLSMLLLVPVFPLLFATYLPGAIKRVLKHPMLVAVKLWALAHLLANGMLADVLLFGSFLAWAVVDRISMKQRTQRTVTKVQASKVNDVVAVVLGLGVYVIFVLWLHSALIGVALIPK